MVERPVRPAAIMVEPALALQDSISVPDVSTTALGDPFARLGPPSSGPGRGGIGGGCCNTVGSGQGAQIGPGEGTGQSGQGEPAQPPRLIYRVEPGYSDEARRARRQGTVLVAVEIDENGRVRNPRVAQSLGLGLDEEAIVAVLKWRFRPSLRRGQPVTTRAYIEVNFRLL